MFEAGAVSERTLAARHAQTDRLKWRSRRGLLELDIVLERFWSRTQQLDEADAAALARLLELPDNDLLDLVMGRADTTEKYLDPMLRRLRTA